MPASTPDERKVWFDRGVAENKTHMLVVCDTFDYDDYPVYVPGDLRGDGVVETDPQKFYDHFHGRNMQKVMEVFDLSKGRTLVDASVMIHDGVVPRPTASEMTG